ncbi:hypothetical protein GTW63_10025, partial [Streptomyces sp. SID6137]|nr:hypothetical protein [Streptomyces sp. SID6137]
MYGPSGTQSSARPHSSRRDRGGTRRMSSLLLLTNALQPSTEVLPALGLL